jgi:hypothetical protein
MPITSWSTTLVVLAAALAHADKRTNCVGWARAGQCEANAAYMHKECAKECSDTRVIVDSFGELEQCAGWSSQGECTRNPKFMLASCPKNCVAQRAAVHEAIVDDRITCLDQVRSPCPARPSSVPLGYPRRHRSPRSRVLFGLEGGRGSVVGLEEAIVAPRGSRVACSLGPVACQLPRPRILLS